MYVPFTGLGLYGGYRGDRWLRNRIKIFKQFVIPSLLAQTDKRFILWVSWRHQERQNLQVQELKEYLTSSGFVVVFTYSGVCFWDDKYSDDVARDRLLNALSGSMGELINYMGDAEDVLMTIQPSDDCYHRETVEALQREFAETDYNVLGFKKGYVMDYTTLKLAEWNPTTTPPFYTIRFPRETFIDPLLHLKYTGPYKSHEYVKDFLKAHYDDERGFIVGTHGENISTIFKHPFAHPLTEAVHLEDFGLDGVEPLKLRPSVRKWVMRKLPHGWQRKLRYWLGERFYSKFYKFIRS